MNNNYKILEHFASEDGEITNIVIECEKSKVFFTKWNDLQLMLFFKDVESITSKHAVGGDIGDFQIIKIDDELNKYAFYDSWTNEVVLEIIAKSYIIYDINSSK